MLIFIAWDGDHIGRQVGRASQNDDVEGLRRISQAIDQGNLIWKSWVESTGGSLISMGGDEGRAEVAADHIGELPAIREQYAGKVGSTVSVGVGMKLSEAEKALIAAKLRGEDQIVFYSEECDKLIEQANKAGEKTEEAKIADEYLNKAAPAMNQGAGAGFQGAQRPQRAAASQGDHEEAQVATDFFDENGNPPEATHAAKDFEKQLHDEAWKGEEDDMGDDADKKARLDAVKQQVVQALQVLKQQAPLMEQVKQVAPQAYQAMIMLSQSVVGMARELAPQPMQKSELTKREGKDKAAKTVDDIRAVLTNDLLKPEYRGAKGCSKGHCYVASEALYHLIGGKEAGWVPHFIMHEGGPHWYLKHVGGRVLDPTADQFDTPVPYDKGQGKGFLTKIPSKRSQEVIERMLSEGTLKPNAAAKIEGTRSAQAAQEKEQLDKGGLPMPGAKSRHNVVLPVGSVTGQAPAGAAGSAAAPTKIKTQHADGSTGWHQAESGQILGQDRGGVGGGVAGHSVSTRNPNAK